MAEQRLHSALAPIDILTRLEMEQIHRKSIDEFFHQEYLGVDWVEKNGYADGAAVAQIPGPDSGYAWSLKLLSVTMTGSDTCAVYLGDNTLTAPVGIQATVAAGNVYTAVLTWSSNAVVVKDQRPVTLAAGSTGIQAWKIIVKQVPGEMIGKLG